MKVDLYSEVDDSFIETVVVDDTTWSRFEELAKERKMSPEDLFNEAMNEYIRQENNE